MIMSGKESNYQSKDKIHRSIQVQVVLLGFIAVLALFLRSNNLLRFPPSPFIDEYNLALAALKFFRQGPQAPWNGFNWYGTPELFIRCLAQILNLFHFQSWSFRLIWSFFGALLLPIIYCLSQKMFNRNIALVSLALLSLSVFHTHLSRWGHGSVIITTLIWLTNLWLYQLIKTQKYRFAVLAALSFVVGLYTYVGMRVYFPVILIATMLYLIISWQQRQRNSKSNLKPIILFLFFVSIFWLPQISAAVRNPVGFFGRTQELSILDFHQSFDYNFSQFLKSAWVQLGLFWQTSDPNLRHNPLQLSTFTWTTLVLALIGLVSGLKQKKYLELSLLGSVILSAVLAGLLSGMQVTIFRSQPLLPAIYLLSGVGFWSIHQFLTHRARLDWWHTFVVLVFIAVSFLLPSIRAYRYLQLTQKSNSALNSAFTFSEYQVALRAKEETKNKKNLYLAPNYYWYSSVQYELKVNNHKQWQNIHIFSLDNFPQKIKLPATLILSHKYQPMLPYFKQIWPQLNLVTNNQNFLIIELPANQGNFHQKKQSIFGLYRTCQKQTNSRLTRGIDPTLYLAWDSNEPIMADKFSCRWQGKMKIEQSGRYQFQLFADDWAKLRFKQNNKTIFLLQSKNQIQTKFVELKSGFVDLTVDYQNYGGAKRIELMMRSPTQTEFKIISPLFLRPY